MDPAILALLLVGQADVPEPTTGPAKPQLICRESEEETGSHIRSGRRCKTEEEWRREDERRGRAPASMRVTEGQGDALTKLPPP
jgi:hypothetical protein